MTAKEYLSQVFRLENKLRIMEMELEEYHRLARSLPSQDFSRERVQGGPINNDAYFVKWIIKAHDKEEEIKQKMQELVVLKAEVLSVIDAVENDNYRVILKLRYIESMKFSDIAKRMFMAESTIKRMHRDALGKIDTK